MQAFYKVLIYNKLSVKPEQRIWDHIGIKSIQRSGDLSEDGDDFTII
jgi:hypothetical protein